MEDALPVRREAVDLPASVRQGGKWGSGHVPFLEAIQHQARMGGDC